MCNIGAIRTELGYLQSVSLVQRYDRKSYSNIFHLVKIYLQNYPH